MTDVRYTIQTVTVSADNLPDGIDAFGVIDTTTGELALVTLHRPIAEMWMEMAEHEDKQE